jgi:hypothetical protein
MPASQTHRLKRWPPAFCRAHKSASGPQFAAECTQAQNFGRRLRGLGWRRLARSSSVSARRSPDRRGFDHHRSAVICRPCGQTPACPPAAARRNKKGSPARSRRSALAIWMRPCLDDPTGQVWFAVVRDCLQVIRLPHPPPVLPSCRRSDVSMMALQTSDKGVLCQQDPAISRPETRVETHVSLYTLACHRRDSNPSLGRCGASGRRAAF